MWFETWASDAIKCSDPPNQLGRIDSSLVLIQFFLYVFYFGVISYEIFYALEHVLCSLHIRCRWHAQFCSCNVQINIMM